MGEWQFLQAPVMGSLFIGFITSILGVMVFIRRRSLIGETLSHATFPGVALIALLAFFFHIEPSSSFILIGAVFFAVLGHFAISAIKKAGRVSDDASLTFVLVGFFGIGVTLMSLLQHCHPCSMKLVISSLFGQIATLDESQAHYYGILSLLILALFILFYKEFKLLAFDSNLARQIVHAKWIDALLFLLVAFVIAIGIRTVGVLLISAMLIAPAVAARKWSDRLLPMLVLSAIFGISANVIGTLLSYYLSRNLDHATLPTGPMIVLVAASITLFSLLFAPKRGVVILACRHLIFKGICYQENILKRLWKMRENEERMMGKGFLLKITLFYFRWRGWVEMKKTEPYLTSKGERAGAKIVRLHRLWESYLVLLGVAEDKVHRSAEEMEHMLNADLEKQLTEMLSDPTHDPHQKPIPKSPVGMEVE